MAEEVVGCQILVLDHEINQGVKTPNIWSARSSDLWWAVTECTIAWKGVGQKCCMSWNKRAKLRRWGRECWKCGLMLYFFPERTSKHCCVPTLLHMKVLGKQIKVIFPVEIIIFEYRDNHHKTFKWEISMTSIFTWLRA